MRMRLTTFVILFCACFAGASAQAFDLQRWLGVGWGPGYHAYNYGGSYQAGSSYYAPAPGNFPPQMPYGYSEEFRAPRMVPEPVPAVRVGEPTPAQPPMRTPNSFQQPMSGPTLTPPFNNSTQAATSINRFFGPLPQYSPAYVGQRAPRPMY